MKTTERSAMFIAIGLLALAPSGLKAQFLSADFREELSLSDDSPADARVLETLGELVAGAPDLDVNDEIANPSSYNGLARIDLDASGLLTLTGDQEGNGFSDYALAVFEISNIAFGSSLEIVGIQTVSDDIVDPTSVLTSPFTVSTFFTDDSVTIVYEVDDVGTTFDFGDGTTSVFQIMTEVPEPSTGALVAFGGVLAMWSRRRRF